MNNNIEILNKLIGKKIISATTEISQVMPINKIDYEAKDINLIEIPLHLVFNEYVLLIYNKWTITNFPSQKIDSLNGVSINLITEENNNLQIHLESAAIIVVNLSDDGYIGPEAMSLYGPNNQVVVWN